MNERLELLLLYKRIRKLVKSLRVWQVSLYKQYSTGVWIDSNSRWEDVEWRKTIENELNEADDLILKYNSLKPSNLPIISIPSFKIGDYNSVDEVLSIIIKVTRILEESYEALSIYIEPQLSEKEKQKINSLRSELEEIENAEHDETIIKNLKEATKEIENNHYLASSMIAARVILYCIDQIEGKNEEEKVQLLTELEVIPKGEKSKETMKWFIKAIKSARNSISHKITIFPSASEAFSILGDSFKMVKIFHEYHQVKNK